jgi:D-alanyl-D-alanine carboxypeptidase
VPQAFGQAQLDELLAQLAANSSDSGGQSVTVLSPQRGIDASSAVGVADEAGSVPMTSDATFRIASVTKTFTAATVLRLMEEGSLDIEAPIATSGLSPQLLSLLTDDGYDVNAITIRHLLNHTSGIADYAGSEEGSATAPYSVAVQSDPTKEWTPLEQVTFAMETYSPRSRPGVEFHYSDTGYVLLGQIIEATTNKTLAASMRELLAFEKLGLSSTWFETIEAPGPSAGPQAKQYLGDVTVNDISPTSDLFGGGGLVSNTHDLALFFDALANGKVFVQPDTFRQMTTTAAPGTKNAEALGIMRFDLAGQACWGHSGFWGTAVFTCPSAGITVAYNVTQSVGAGDPIAMFEAILDSAADDKVEVATATPASAEKALARAIELAPQPCPADMPANGTCGLASVPLDWTDPASDTIKVWYGTVPPSQADDGTTIVPINGGPGYSISGDLATFGATASAAPSATVLFVDPRGTGIAQPLDCDLQRATAVIYGDDGRKAVGDCGEQLGQARDFYTTAANVMDIESIRRALKLSDPSVIGFSYGTMTASSYAVLFPNEVRAVVLDGALALDNDEYSSQVANGITTVAKRVCRQTTCDGDKVARDFATVAALLRDTPLPIEGTNAQLTESMLITILGPAPQAADLVAFEALAMAASGDWTALLAYAKTTQSLEPLPVELISSALQATIWCNDLSFPFDLTDPSDLRAAQLQKNLDALSPKAFGPFSKEGWRDTAIVAPDECLMWPQTNVPEGLRSPKFGPFPDVPVLVVNGDLDLQTPLPWAFAAGAQFPNSVVVKVPNAGHPSAVYNPCVYDAAFAFMTTATLPAADVCMDQQIALPSSAGQ